MNDLKRRFLISGFYEDLDVGCTKQHIEALLGQPTAAGVVRENGRQAFRYESELMVEFAKDGQVTSLQAVTTLEESGKIVPWPKLMMFKTGKEGLYAFVRDMTGKAILSG